jgi:hypothetical protein
MSRSTFLGGGGVGQKIRSPTCAWHGAEIYLVVDYLGLIHVLSNLDLKLLMVSCVRWSGVSAHEGMMLKNKSHIFPLT